MKRNDNQLAQTIRNELATVGQLSDAELRERSLSLKFSLTPVATHESSLAMRFLS